ncbi:hypothetical protein SAMN05216389_11217 [Oceanobacillus limi]|uniref:Uncharacterized protein n=1 Tax=Oceanobacillus limi TaxID=930131 RepID=A0A1I0EQA7_9BACI|nr:hypothetical protein [Oceanobacillus limi]SET46964.1 hypothetical protein SAMN05216389_11217 [Oceanobacillus limi]
MWQLWQEPLLILGGLIVFEIIRRYSSKTQTPFRKSVLNVAIPTLIVIVISFVGDKLLH